MVVQISSKHLGLSIFFWGGGGEFRQKSFLVAFPKRSCTEVWKVKV